MISFELTDTQNQMIDTVRRFRQDVVKGAETELDKIADPKDVFSSETYKNVMQQAYELGINRMAIAEEYGGLGLDGQTTGMVWEELARDGVGFAAGLIAGSIVPHLITHIASENSVLMERYVRPFCEDRTGTYVTAWGSSEPEVGSDGSQYDDPKIRHHVTALKKGNKYIINGSKSSFVSNGGLANAYVIFASIDPSMGIKGSGVFIIPADASGVNSGQPLDKMGLRTLNQAAVTFDDVEVSEDHLIFPHGDAYPMLHNTIVTVGNIGVGYLAVGVMQGAYDEALAYAKDRVQGGKPIIQHQLIADKMFECYQAIETARTYLWKASWHSTTGFPGDLKTSIAAKVYATQQAIKQTSAMLQILGGYGISKEYRLEKYARDANLLRIMDGTYETLVMKAAALL